MVQVTHKQLNLPTTVVALVNGMIGGSILVIPLASVQAGWAYTIIVMLLTGVFSFYSCYLSVIHLGDQKDLDQALLRHFNGNRFLKVFYDFCVWIGMVLILMLYFDLIVLQWEGLVPPNTFTYANVLINAAFVFVWCIVLKFFELGAHIMGYGIASIVGYLIFLIWVISTRPAGPNTIPAFGSGVAGFAAMMGSAFSIQGFFIPVMKGYPKESKHVWILLLAYIIGTAAYTYIAYMGSYGIVNRKNYQNLGTIQQYFTSSQWQVKLLQGIYLVHLYSVFPEYMIVCKKRFFSMFGVKQTGRKSISVVQIVYIMIVIGICLLFSILKVNIDVIIDINGAVLGFCFIYLLPSILHIKCSYFPKGKRELAIKQELFAVTDDSTSRRDSITSQANKEESPEQLISVQEKTPQIYQIQMEQTGWAKSQENKEKPQITNQKIDRTLTAKVEQGALKTAYVNQSGQQSAAIIQDYSYFYCAYVKPSLKKQIIEMTLLGVMFLFGIFIMVNGLIQVVDIIKGK